MARNNGGLFSRTTTAFGVRVCVRVCVRVWEREQYIEDILEKSPIFTLELSQKSDFQPSTTKPDNIGHPTVKTGQIWLLGGFEGGFLFCEN